MSASPRLHHKSTPLKVVRSREHLQLEAVRRNSLSPSSSFTREVKPTWNDDNETKTITFQYGQPQGPYLVSSASAASLNEIVPVLELPAPPDGKSRTIFSLFCLQAFCTFCIGGWGWAVVAASFMCNFVLDGIAYSFGILLPPLASHFGASRASVAWVGSLLAGIYQVSKPLKAVIIFFGRALARSWAAWSTNSAAVQSAWPAESSPAWPYS